MEVIDPCINHVTVTPQLQTIDTLPTYYYTGDTPSAQFTMVAFAIDPDFCTPVHSCDMISGARLDLCSIAESETSGTFNAASGDYELVSN